MTVQQLIEELKELPLNAEVVIDLPSRDLWDILIEKVDYDKTTKDVHLTVDDQ